MSNLPNAEQSPRVVNGVIRWYQGDTFDLDLVLDIVDQDGAPITIAASHTVKVTFRDKSQNLIKEFTFSNISNNTVTLAFDAECTALFPKGQYTYDVCIAHDKRTTIANENKAVVE